MIKVAIFASGKGSNAECIYKYFQDHLQIQIVLFAGNNKDAGIADLADKLNLPFLYFTPLQLKDREFMLSKLTSYKVDWIILAGFLLKIPEYLINDFTDRIINIHPALLPSYGGKGMYGSNVHQAVLEAGEIESGISIHMVNKEYDKGRILFQAKSKIDRSDTVSTLQKKIQALEHMYFPQIIEKTILEAIS